MSNQILGKATSLFKRNRFLLLLISAHLIFSFGLGKVFVLAPDEHSYLFTFDNIYSNPSLNPQFYSGWITSPQIFLWIVFAPAKFLTIFGLSSIFALRIQSILLTAISYLLLRSILYKRSSDRKGVAVLNYAFSIPSIFLWGSLGLREAFLVFAFCLFSFSIIKLVEEKKHLY